MPRPRQFDTDDVLDKVTEVFWAGGFDAVSIQQIAKATGLRPGSLHVAFGNKQDLFNAAFARYREHFEACMDVGVDGVGGASLYLDRLVRAAAQDPVRKGCFIVNTAAELASHIPSTQAEVRDRLDDMRGFFRQKLAEDGVHSEPAVNTLFGAAVAILTLARAQQPEEVLQDIASTAVEAARRYAHA